MSEYNCSICEKTFTKVRDDTWNEKKAAEEYLELHPEGKNDRTDIVCDECFKQYKAWLTTQTDEDKRKMRNEYDQMDKHSQRITIK